MTRLSQAFAAWDRAVSLGTDATAADWSAVADAWRAVPGDRGGYLDRFGTVAARIAWAERLARGWRPIE